MFNDADLNLVMCVATVFFTAEGEVCSGEVCSKQ